MNINNMVTLCGRLTADPIIEVSEKGIRHCKFRLACTRDFKQGTVDFIDVVAFEKTAEFLCKNFEKGEFVRAVGSLRPYSFETDAGERRYGYSVVVETAGF